VEDERIITRKEEKILSAQLEQMNLEVAVGESESKGKKDDVDLSVPAITINVNAPVGTNLPLINPSPKDNDQYRSRYFEDSGGPNVNANRGVRRRKQEHDVIRNKNSLSSANNDIDSLQTKKSVDNQVFDVWASTVASQEERHEAISFDQTDQWLDRDPDIDDSLAGEDASIGSEQGKGNQYNVESTAKKDPEPRPIIIKKPPQSFRTPEMQKQRSRATGSTKKAKKPEKQEVFDPFGIDAEESNGLTVEISDDLFSPNPDPFMTEESFSPLEWSTKSGGSQINVDSSKHNPNSPPHIGYYNSPDSRVEI